MPEPLDPTMELIRQYGAHRVNRNAEALRETVRLLVERLDGDRAEAYQRGIAKGRRQAAEAIESALVADAVRYRSTSWDSLRHGADLARRVGLAEPAEQPEPAPVVDITPDPMLHTHEVGTPAPRDCPECAAKLAAEQPEDGAR